MKKQFKHVNPKILLRKVYTEQGGVKEYNKNQQVIGILKFAGGCLEHSKTWTHSG